MLTVSQKLAILEEAEQTGSFKITARKHRLQKIQLIKWSASMEKLIEKRKLSRNALTIHKGPVVLNLEIELQVLDWVYGQRNRGFFVSTRNIITKMLQMNPKFKGGCVNTIRWWVYRFLRRHKLALRRHTRVSQHTPAEAEAVRESFAQSTMTYIQMNDIPRCLFVNMDETAIYFDTPHHTTVNVRGAKTVSVRRGSSSTQRCTLCITVAADGAKLPLFVIFKARPNGTIAKNLHQILPAGMHGCVQEKGWMDNRVMSIWKEKVWFPYIQGSSKSALLLDAMESHIHSDFIDAVDERGTQVLQILGGFTSVCQPCDVGIMKPFKTRLAEKCQDWKVCKYSNIGGSGKIPSPARSDV